MELRALWLLCGSGSQSSEVPVIVFPLALYISLMIKIREKGYGDENGFQSERECAGCHACKAVMIVIVIIVILTISVIIIIVVIAIVVVKYYYYYFHSYLALLVHVFFFIIFYSWR